ncbi:MAG: hypothetical protein J6V26_03990 [Alistipes sp.]|nr:hypothetical protein [Alistipes sp.]
MKIYRVTIRFVAAILLGTLSIGMAQAQERHNISISWALGARGNYGLASHTALCYVGDLDNTPQEPREGSTLWLSATLDYGYKINEWFSVGGCAAWTAGLCNLYDNQTLEHWDTIHVDYLSLMPTVRFTWLRRSIVELYSSMGITAGIEHWIHYTNGKQHTYRPYLSYDVKPLGISIGRKWYGFMETGYGARGILNVGVGHQF